MAPFPGRGGSRLSCYLLGVISSMCWKTPQSWPLKVSFSPCPFISAFLGFSEASLPGPHQALISPEVVQKIIISFLTEKRYFFKLLFKYLACPDLILFLVGRL